MTVLGGGCSGGRLWGVGDGVGSLGSWCMTRRLPFLAGDPEAAALKGRVALADLAVECLGIIQESGVCVINTARRIPYGFNVFQDIY